MQAGIGVEANRYYYGNFNNLSDTRPFPFVGASPTTWFDNRQQRHSESAEKSSSCPHNKRHLEVVSTSPKETWLAPIAGLYKRRRLDPYLVTHEDEEAPSGVDVDENTNPSGANGTSHLPQTKSSLCSIVPYSTTSRKRQGHEHSDYDGEAQRQTSCFRITTDAWPSSLPTFAPPQFLSPCRAMVVWKSPCTKDGNDEVVLLRRSEADDDASPTDNESESIDDAMDTSPS
mmetsp:Transcript_15435/g.31350  ORF Transcript_15435/g.31350 Transcript_15435/m.31350 type:complete len:230 (+) Transcript_15435:87-776(+)